MSTVKTPKTFLELWRAVREVVGADRAIWIEASILEYEEGRAKEQWTIHIHGADPSDPIWSSSDVVAHNRRSLAAVWLAFVDLFAPETVAAEQFDLGAAEAEVAHAG